MKKSKTLVALAAVVLTVAGVYFLAPVSARPYWWGNQTEEDLPPMWDEAGFNGTYGYGPWHNANGSCPWWEEGAEGEEPGWSYPPWHDPEWEPSEDDPDWRPGSGCDMSRSGYRGSNRGGSQNRSGARNGRGGMMGRRGNS